MNVLYTPKPLTMWSDGVWAMYNPIGLSLETLPKIFGFNNGGDPGFYVAQLLTQDGWGIGSHICSHEGFMQGDLGITHGSRPDRHEEFRSHYPRGYRMEFVSSAEAANHTEFKAALKLGEAMYAEIEAEAEREVAMMMAEATTLDANISDSQLRESESGQRSGVESESNQDQDKDKDKDTDNA